MATAYVLIDFENVQPKELGAFGGGGFKVKVFAGAKQPRMKLDLVETLLPLGDAVELVRIEGTGRNALDMHIAYYIGRLSIEDPGAAFYIVSKDTDYHPLIAHLKKKFKITCSLHAAVTEIPNARLAPPKVALHPKAQPAAKPQPKPVPRPIGKAAPKVAKAAAKALSDRVERVLLDLQKRGNSRPTTRKTLESTIRNLFRDAPDKDIIAIVNELTLRGEVRFDRDKVSYPPPV